jgi:hypothetical protein
LSHAIPRMTSASDKGGSAARRNRKEGWDALLAIFTMFAPVSF